MASSLGRNLKIIIVALTVTSALVGGPLISRHPGSIAFAGSPSKDLQDELAKSRSDLIQAANDYKESLNRLLEYIDKDVERASETVEKWRRLYQEGLISRKDMEAAEAELADAIARRDDTRKQIGEADTLIAEVEAAELLTIPPAGGAYTSSSALIRYNGASNWTISDISKVEGFFVTLFNRRLPISALGQTALHSSLGLDHSNAVDIAVHPDSAEGREIMAFLRESGIAFIAFRSAVPGSSTGPHIHIGHPSRRITR